MKWIILDKSQINEKSSNWAGLLDELKKQESVSSDAKLAAKLGVTRGYICSVRKGRKNISLPLAKVIFSKLGRTFDGEALENLFVPREVRKYTYNLSQIRRDVILRANERCQLCGNDAPFIDKDDFPYLEIHHIVPVSEGGGTTISNLIALCPNCNKKVELCPTQIEQEKIKQLQKKYLQQT